MRRLLRSSVLAAVRLVLLSLAAALPAQQWQPNPANGLLYSLSPLMTWDQAEAHAIGLGGHLVAIRNQDEQDWLLTTFGTQNLWIGLNNPAELGTFS